MSQLPVIEAPCCEPVLVAPIDAHDADTVAASFKAIADPVRLRLLSLIGTNGEMCACDLPALVDRSQPTVSHHLKILVEAGLLLREQRGKWAWYRVDASRIGLLKDVLAAPSPEPATA